MNTATILNFPIRTKSEICQLNLRTQLPQGTHAAPSASEAFWLVPGEAENNLETLFWFRGEDPLHHAPKLVDIEEIALTSRTWLRRLTILEGEGEKMEVLGHASFEEKWDIQSDSRKLLVTESSLPPEWIEDLQNMLEAESNLASTPPAVHLVGPTKNPNPLDFNPTLLGLV